MEVQMFNIMKIYKNGMGKQFSKKKKTKIIEMKLLYGEIWQKKVT